MNNKGSELEVITAEQGTLLDKAKVYSQAHAQTELHERMYLFLVGATLQQLKEITPHGGFEKLKLANFPEAERSRLGRAMNFAEAVQHFAKGKYPTIGYLEEGARLLEDSELKDADKDKLAAEISQATKGRGVMETIGDWRKKIHKLKPQGELTPEEIAAQQLKASTEYVRNLRSGMALAQTTEYLATVNRDELDALEEERISLGNYIKLLRQNRKVKKS